MICAEQLARGMPTVVDDAVVGDTKAIMGEHCWLRVADAMTLRAFVKAVFDRRKTQVIRPAFLLLPQETKRRVLRHLNAVDLQNGKTQAASIRLLSLQHWPEAAHIGVRLRTHSATDQFRAACALPLSAQRWYGQYSRR